MKQQNHEVEKLNMGLQLKRGEQGSSLRDKYMDKLNQLKEKKQQESVARHEEAENGTTSEGLSTWLVNDGANEVLSYSDLRGFFKAIIPPRNPLQNDEYLQFQKEMEGHFDLFVSIDELEEFRDSKPIINICQHLDLQPSDMIVLARHARTLKAAKDAGTHVCHYMPEDKAIPNHTAHYHLTHLCDYQHLIENYNGISYRDKITLGSIKF